MRNLAPLLITAALAGCMAAPPPPGPTPRAQERLSELLTGKVAGPPVSCLPSYKANDMVVVDDNTLAFKDSTSRVYVNHPQGGCSSLSAGHTALVTRTPGSGLCRGDIAQVVDTLNGITVGSCVINDFIPYTRPGA